MSTASVTTVEEESGRTVWYSAGLEESSWCPLRAEHTVRVTSSGDYSVYVRDKPALEDAEGEGSLMAKMWNSVKCGVRHFLPSVYCSMHAEALVQESPDSMSLGIVVIVRQAANKGYRPRPHNYPAGTSVVGRTLTPRAVKSGCLQVRLISKDFVADTEQGEDIGLCKVEPDFRGQDFEKQFACRYKLGPVKDGIFGKVVIEHRRESGELDTVLEFNLTKGGENTPVTVTTQQAQQSPSSPLKGMLPSDVARRPILELAASLRITEGQNWRTLASHIGFSGKEVCRFASHPDPFSRVISAYQSRGGSADEIVQALYDVSRQFSPSPVKRQRTMSPENVRRSPMASQGSISSQTTILIGESEDETESSLTESLSRSDTLELGPKGIFPLTSSPFTVTPPTTPRKRNSSSCSEYDSVLTRSPAVKRMRTSLFSFDDPEDLARRMCVEALDEGAIWRVSQHMQREWKHVGRTLHVPETELFNIEHANKDLRECAYQTLLRWKDMFPRKFTYGTLYSALCENGLSAHAQAFCTV